ncbi:MAG: TIGR01777 family oxidoreductase [Acidimicrobiales bacterium]
MRVGITGSSGFIGTALVEALLERGDEVVRFIRPGADQTASTVRWDPSRQLVDDGDLQRAGRLEAVVHLAGAGIADKRWNDTRKREIVTSRTQSTALLVSTLAALPDGTPRLASGSAIGFYGSRGDEVLNESSSAGHGFLAATCKQWEESALALRARGTTVALLRTGIVLDRRGGSLKRQLPLFQWGLGGTLANGHQWTSPISLRDEVRAILWIIDHDIDGPVNLTCPTPLANRDFTRVLAHEMHRPHLARVPRVGLQIVLGAQLTSEAVLASQRVVPHVLVEGGFSFEHPDATSIVRAALEK